MTARTWLVPQVLQSSLMDCGPASLKSVLSGFGREVSYDELRERCQTDVDGTSLSALAALGGEYGLTSREVLVKRDCLLLPASASLPAIVVTRAGGGNLHFVVVWRRWGPFVQIMDPGSGRKWLSTRRILEQLTDIPIALTATRWRRWAGAEHTRAIWKARMRQLGMRAAAIELQLGKALEDPTWRSLGTLDAALRMVHELVQRAAVRAGGEAQGLLHALSEVTAPGAEFARVPPQYWWVTPHAVEPGKLIVKGCVIVSFAQSTQCSARSGPTLAEHDAQAPERQPRSAAILPSGADFGPRAKHSPMKMLWQIARAEQSPRLFAAALALMACALVVPLEAVLLRGLLSLRPGTVLDYQLALGMCALLLLLSVAAWLDGFQAERVQQIGSALEAKLRVALLSKLPLLEDRYLRTRPVSDMASRAHALHHIQEIPTLWSQAARALLDLLAALCGLVWLDAGGARWIVTLALSTIVCPFFARRSLIEASLRLRTQGSALERFYLDALIGAQPVRVHGAEQAVRREHEALLVEWARSARGLLTRSTGLQALQLLASAVPAVALVGHFAWSEQSPAAILLVAFWALRMPIAASELVNALLGLRSYHAVVLRLVAPLAAKECGPALAESEDGEGPAAALRFENLTVQIAGRAVLEEVDLTIAAGEHVAIVGPSGAGKSSLIGLLLGWLQPTRGVLSVDGTPLDRATQRRLRTQSAWIDPAVRLWDESLFDNLMYGREGASTTNLQAVLERADLLDVLEVLPDGLQSRLGEGGAQLSGGQGQRVRIGRGMLRERPRLVLLDEPFRGLERAARRAILTRLREHWRSSTLLFVSHDIADSTLLDRVLVVEGGRIVEADTPARLLALPGSRYRALLEAEQQLQRELWQGPHFRHHRLSEGYLHEEASACP